MSTGHVLYTGFPLRRAGSVGVANAPGSRMRCPLARSLALLLLILPCKLLSAQDNSISERKITVLTQGPIHEAYAQPIDKNPQPVVGTCDLISALDLN